MKKGKVYLNSIQKTQHADDLKAKYKPYFTLNDVYFCADNAYAFIGKFRYRLSKCAQLIDDVLYVAFEDFQMIYGAKFQFTRNEGEIRITEKAVGTAVIVKGQKIKLEKENYIEELDETPLCIDNTLFLPVEGLMVLGFGKKSKWMRSYLGAGDFLGISDDGNMFPDVQFSKDFVINSIKSVGIVREMYYYEKSNSLEPYRLYIPSYYNSDKKYKLIVWLHGAWPNYTVDLDMDLARQKFEELAEAGGYLLLAVNGYSFGFYGGRSPQLNVDNISTEEQHYLDLCENEPLHAITAVCQRYSIDISHIYLCGNSMGGAGTFWIAMRHAGIFRALAPCGSLTNLDFTKYDLSALQKMPVLLVCGTENVGYENMRHQTEELRRLGVDAHLHTVPAGFHDDAWTYALPNIFSFFNGCD